MGIFNLIKLLTIGVIIVVSLNSQELMPRFKICDDTWGNDELWINFASEGKLNYTFCHDEEGGEAMFLNGKLMTLLADGLRWKGVPCGNLGPCTPGIINKLIIKLDFSGETLIETLRLNEQEKLNTKIKIVDYIKENYILISSVKVEDKWKFFIIMRADTSSVFGIDHEGNEITTAIQGLTYFAGWRVLPLAEKMDFLE